jgi:hypothetical protein
MSGHTNSYYYFVEKETLNQTYTCDFEGDVGTDKGSSHVERVSKVSGSWKGYVDGTNLDPLSNSWPAGCNGTGNACGLYAWAEDRFGQWGCWDGKFSGTTNTPWSFDNGTQWNQINTYQFQGFGSNWSTNLPRPNGGTNYFPGSGSGDPNNFWYINNNNNDPGPPPSGCT